MSKSFFVVGSWSRKPASCRSDGFRRSTPLECRLRHRRFGYCRSQRRNPGKTCGDRLGCRFVQRPNEIAKVSLFPKSRKQHFKSLQQRNDDVAGDAPLLLIVRYATDLHRDSHTYRRENFPAAHPIGCADHGNQFPSNGLYPYRYGMVRTFGKRRNGSRRRYGNYPVVFIVRGAYDQSRCGNKHCAMRRG